MFLSHGRVHDESTIATPRRAKPSDQDYFRPWLFQAPPGSYQFAVRLESPKQMELGIIPGPFSTSAEVTGKFLEIVSSTAADPEGALSQIVPDSGYRNAFLKLTRNLAPAKVF